MDNLKCTPVSLPVKPASQKKGFSHDVKGVFFSKKPFHMM
jgi:hypothetical protein